MEAEQESVRDLATLVERLSSSTQSLTRYQELSALLEVSEILARMSSSSADEIFRNLSNVSKDQFRTEAYKIVSKNQPAARLKPVALTA